MVSSFIPLRNRDYKQEYEGEIKISRVMVFRRMLRVSWLDSQSNEVVLEMAGAQRSLINSIRKRRMPLFDLDVENKCLKI